MGLFKKRNPEGNYDDHKHFKDVLKNHGDSSHLIWRLPKEDFNNHSTLIVMPGEQAIFVNKGEIVQVFENGTYTLSTQNYPFLSRLRNVVTGGVSRFNCVVYFINTTLTKDIRWGTTSPVQVRDPKYMIESKIQGRGAYKIRISDPASFLKQLIGNRVNDFSAEKLNAYFFTEFQENIRTAIASRVLAMTQTPPEQRLDLLSICSMQKEMAKEIAAAIQPSLSEYGIELISVNIEALEIPMNDPGRKRIENAIAHTMEVNIQKELYDKDRAMRLAEKAIDKPYPHQHMTVAGMGVGVVTTGSHEVPGMVSQSTVDYIARQAFEPSSATPASETASSANGRQDDVLATASKLKQMLDMGLITQEQYNNKIQEILQQM